MNIAAKRASIGVTRSYKIGHKIASFFFKAANLGWIGDLEPKWADWAKFRMNIAQGTAGREKAKVTRAVGSLAQLQLVDLFVEEGNVSPDGVEAWKQIRETIQIHIDEAAAANVALRQQVDKTTTSDRAKDILQECLGNEDLVDELMTKLRDGGVFG